MRKLIMAIVLAAALLGGCFKSASPALGKNTADCGTYRSGQQLFLGPEGGCYYYTSGSNKRYVERSACRCSL